MALRLHAVAFDVADASATAAFWAGLLDREVVTEAGAALLPGDPTQVKRVPSPSSCWPTRTGNELCVIEPGNRYLAGTGYLGEVTCEGTRSVGSFWRDALGWPLVWDEEQQTAIQSPLGGTKIAWDSWDGSPDELRDPRNR